MADLPKPKGVSLIELSRVLVSANNRDILSVNALTIPPSSLCIILGPNGSGKTTLLRSVLGLQKLTTGQIAILGRDRCKIPIQDFSRMISWMPQSNSTSFDYSVIQVTLMGRFPWHRGLPSKLDHQRCESVLRDLQYDLPTSLQMSQLSGGERQRVFLARSLVGDHQFLILDEPGAYLDLKNFLHLLEYLKTRAKNGQSIVMSMHDLSMANRYANWIGLLSAGRVTVSGLPEETLTPETLTHAFGASARVDHLVDGRRIFDFYEKNTK